MRQTALNCVYELAKTDSRIMFIGSDLGAGTLDKFKAEHPDRFMMEGVSEAHIIGMSAGLAMEGKIPYLNTIATFLTRRCYEQVCLDLCLHNQKVRLIGSGGGVVYAPLGPTHLAIEDIAIFRTLPNMTIVAPADAEEMKRLMPLTVECPGPMYIRLGKGGDPVVTIPSMGFEIGKAYPMREGKDVLLVSTGICLKLCLEAADALQAKGIGAAVLHVPTIKPFDEKTFLALASTVRGIVTVEEHVIVGGLGSLCAETLLEGGVSGKRFKRIGIQDTFPHKYGSQDSLMKSLGISTESILEAAQGIC